MTDPALAAAVGRSFSNAALAIVGAAIEQNRPAVETALTARGLSSSQVNSQDLSALANSLAAINALIDDPSSLGRFNAFPGGSADSQTRMIRFNPKPILLERKTLILQRTALLEQQEQLNTVVGAATQMSAQGGASPDVEGARRAQAANADRQQELQREIEQTELERRQSIFDTMAYESHQLALRKQQASIWQSYFSRDVVAGVAGLLLLLLFGVTIVVAMFVHTKVSAIIANSFLLILGYFFGQAGGKIKSARARKQPDAN